MSGKPFRLRDEYLSRPQLAHELNKTVRSLQRWEREHSGPTITHIGKTPYYSAETVRAWLTDQEKRHAPPAPAASSNGEAG